MHQLLVRDISGKTLCVTIAEKSSCGDLLLHLETVTGVPACHQRLLLEGRDVSADDHIPCAQNGWVSGQLLLRLRGGKGGFAANLRSMGSRAAQKQTTNFEACRDLNGRRLRTVHDEEKLAEWLANEEKRKEEAEEKKRRKKEQLLRGPLHKFDHHKLGVESREVTRVVEDAVSSAMEKRKAGDAPASSKPHAVKKLKMWEEDLSGSELEDSDDEDSSQEKGKAPAVYSDSDSGTSAQVDSVEGFSTLAQVGSSDEDAAVSPSLSSNDKASSSAGSDRADAGHDAASKATATAEATEFPEIDLNKYKTAAQLEKCGLEHLKHALMARGLKCGGNVHQRAERLFSVKGLTLEEYPAALKAKK